MLPLSPTSNITSRKFIDTMMKSLIRKRPNWNPEHSIKVGDFGKIDKDTGELAVQGNIYDPDTNIYRDVDGDIRKLVQGHPPIVADRTGSVRYSSNGGKSSLDLEYYSSVPELADASILGKWKFDSDRGGVLIMARPRNSYIPPGTFLEQLAKIEALKDVCLVTQVYVCPAFAFYLSNKSDDEVSLALLGSVPVSARKNNTTTWWSSTTDGVFRSGHMPNGEDGYAPLYTLKTILPERRKLRCPPSACKDDDLWVNAESPWEPLDEDGNEVPFEDTIFDWD